MRASSQSTVRHRSRHPTEGAIENAVSSPVGSSGASMKRACTPSPRRTAGISPRGITITAGTHGFDESMNSHTLVNSIGTHKCSKRVYVVPHSSGRRNRAIASSCQQALTTDLPGRGEDLHPRGGGSRSAAATLGP